MKIKRFSAGFAIWISKKFNLRQSYLIWVQSCKPFRYHMIYSYNLTLKNFVLLVVCMLFVWNFGHFWRVACINIGLHCVTFVYVNEYTILNVFCCVDVFEIHVVAFCIRFLIRAEKENSSLINHLLLFLQIHDCVSKDVIIVSVGFNFMPCLLQFVYFITYP